MAGMELTSVMTGWRDTNTISWLSLTISRSPFLYFSSLLLLECLLFYLLLSTFSTHKVGKKALNRSWLISLQLMSYISMKNSGEGFWLVHFRSGGHLLTKGTGSVSKRTVTEGIMTQIALEFLFYKTYSVVQYASGLEETGLEGFWKGIVSAYRLPSRIPIVIELRGHQSYLG